MKLELKVSSGEYKEYLDRLSKYNVEYKEITHKCPKSWRFPDGIFITWEATIEINTIEDIMEISNLLKREIIISTYDNNFFLEIYDDYRE